MDPAETAGMGKISTTKPSSTVQRNGREKEDRYIAGKGTKKINRII